jgi:GT2 family glycosyltransferase
VHEDPYVVLVVVTWNSARHLPALLGSLPEACEGIDRWALVVVDNASSDDTVSAVGREVPSATLIEMGVNAGYGAAVNAGLAASRDADAVLILNPDLVLGPCSVQALLKAFQDPRVGIAVPRLVNDDGTTALSLRRRPTVLRAVGEAVLGGPRAGRFEHFGELVVDPAAYERPTTADWATGAAMLISRACLDLIGMFDESFFLYSEETEYALRARDHRLELRYVPDAEVHHVGGSAHTSPRLWSILTVNRVRLYERRHGRAAALAFKLAVGLNEIIRLPFRRREHWAALTALFVPGRKPREIGGLR